MNPPPRTLRLLLLLALALALWPISRSFPHEQTLLLKLGPESQRIVEISLGWSQDSQPLGGARLRFDSGAPERVVQVLDLANGAYNFTFDLVKRDVDGSTVKTLLQRQVTLEGQTVTIYLEEPSKQ